MTEVLAIRSVVIAHPNFCSRKSKSTHRIDEATSQSWVPEGHGPECFRPLCSVLFTCPLDFLFSTLVTPSPSTPTKISQNCTMGTANILGGGKTPPHQSTQCLDFCNLALFTYFLSRPSSEVHDWNRRGVEPAWPEAIRNSTESMWSVTE